MTLPLALATTNRHLGFTIAACFIASGLHAQRKNAPSGSKFEEVGLDSITPEEFRGLYGQFDRQETSLLILARQLVAQKRDDLLAVMLSERPTLTVEGCIVGMLRELDDSPFKDQLVSTILREKWSLDEPPLVSTGLPSYELIGFGIRSVNKHLPGVVGAEGTDAAKRWFVTRKSRIRLADALDKALRGEPVGEEVARLAAGGPLLPGETPAIPHTVLFRGGPDAAGAPEDARRTGTDPPSDLPGASPPAPTPERWPGWPWLIGAAAAGALAFGWFLRRRGCAAKRGPRTR